MTIAELIDALNHYDRTAIVSVADKNACGNGLYYPIDRRLSIVGVYCNGVHNGKHTSIVILTEK